MDRSKYWNYLYLLVALFFVAFIIAFPKFHLKFKVGSFEVDKMLEGPNIDLFLFGESVQKQLDMKMGLALNGGYRLNLIADMTNVEESEKENKLAQVTKELKDRAYKMGLEDFRIWSGKVDDSYKVYFEIGNYEDFQAVMLTSTTGNLTFKQLTEANKGTEDTTVLYSADSYEETSLTAADLREAKIITVASDEDSTEEPAIQLVFTDDGLAKFAELAKNNVGNPIAIMIDNSIISAPSISEDFIANKISNPVISGGFTEDYANKLATLINSGSLSTPIDVETTELMDPWINESSLNTIFYGVSLTLIVVCILFVIFYRNLGTIFSISTGFYLVLAVAFAKFGFPTILSWIFGNKLGEDFFESLVVTIPLLLGLLFSFLLFVYYHLNLFSNIKSADKNSVLNIETLKSSLNMSFNRVKVVSLFGLILSILIGRFAVGGFSDFGLGFGLFTLVGIFTYLALTQVLVTLFYKSDVK